MIAFAMAPALPAPIGTFTLLLTPHVLSSAKNLRPQFTVVSVIPTTMLIAGTICAHFEVAPQPLLPHDVSVMSLFIEPEASSMMRMSGGSLFTGCENSAQFIPVTAP